MHTKASVRVTREEKEDVSATVSRWAQDGDGNVRKDTWGLWNSGGGLFLGLGGVYSGV